MTDLFRVHVERGHYFQIQPLAVKITGDGLTEVSHPYHGDVHRRRTVEDAVDEIYQYLDVIPFFRIARKAYQHQVAAHLYGRDALHAGEHMRKYVRNTLTVQIHQRAAVLAQSLNGLLGNIIIGHNRIVFVFLSVGGLPDADGIVVAVGHERPLGIARIAARTRFKAVGRLQRYHNTA